jgi:transcription factor-like protein
MYPHHLITDLRKKSSSFETSVNTVKAPSPVVDDGVAPSLTSPTLAPLPSSSKVHIDENLASISQKLQAMLPSRPDCLRIYKLGGYASLCYRQYFSGSFGGWKMPGPNFCEEHVSLLMQQNPHPAVLGKRMLGLAATLQRVRHQADSLTEPPAQIQTRVAQAVMALVCADDRLIGTMEGLECIVMQAVYFANGGDLRLALLACRRAITVCHLMGLHQRHTTIQAKAIEPDPSIDPRLLWMRTVYIERMICLLLGLPNVAEDMNDSGDGEFSSLSLCDTALGRLERAQCIIASKIIKRNQKDPCFRNSRAETLALDLELQKTAALLPPRWWTIPLLSGTDKNQFELFMETNKVLHQLFYHFLLVQLHLPFILRPSSDPENLASKMTCTNASRNALARFVAIRTASELPNIPEASDFFALVAATALLLVHIDAHRGGVRGVDMSLRHQRQTDRALIMDTLDHMRSSSSRSSEILSKRSADVLRRLLEIEEDAAAGQTYTASPGPDLTEADDGEEEGRMREFRLKIPHFGTLIISPDRPVARAPPGEGLKPVERPDAGEQVALGTAPTEAETLVDSSPLQSFTGQNTSGETLYTGYYDLTVPGGNGSSLTDMGQPADMLGSGCDDFQPGQENWFPSISATVEDWAFQGVDAAFFDSVMRGLESPSPPPS